MLVLQRTVNIIFYKIFHPSTSHTHTKHHHANGNKRKINPLWLTYVTAVAVAAYEDNFVVSMALIPRQIPR